MYLGNTHLCTFINMYLFIMLLQVPKFNRGRKAGQNQNSVRNNFHRFYVSRGFSAFMGFCNIYVGLGGSTPYTLPCFLSVYSLKFSPGPP